MERAYNLSDIDFKDHRLGSIRGILHGDRRPRCGRQQTKLDTASAAEFILFPELIWEAHSAHAPKHLARGQGFRVECLGFRVWRFESGEGA